jgi:hypothetical protein
MAGLKRETPETKRRDLMGLLSREWPHFLQMFPGTDFLAFTHYLQNQGPKIVTDDAGLVEALERFTAERIRKHNEELSIKADAELAERKKTHIYPVLCQEWEESEQGWGVRPDGCTLHLNEEGRVQFIDAYWARQPKEVPYEYSRESGRPYICLVDWETFKAIRDSAEGGVWKFQSYKPVKPTQDELLSIMRKMGK